MVEFNDVQRIVDMIGAKDVLDTNGASKGLDVTFSKDPHGIVNMAVPNKMIDECW